MLLNAGIALKDVIGYAEAMVQDGCEKAHLVDVTTSSLFTMETLFAWGFKKIPAKLLIRHIATLNPST